MYVARRFFVPEPWT